MNVMKLTGKGQFTLSKPFLEHICAKPGDQVVVTKLMGNAVKITSKANFTPLDALKGCIEVSTSYSDDDIQNVIKDAYVKSGISGLESEQ